MHFVGALDRVQEIRCVLGLHETVVTGAADGYGRMARKPAATLLHLTPGLANGLAGLHVASRAKTPIVNIVGDHATWHKSYDSPLNADIEAIADQYSAWLYTCKTAKETAARAADAITAANTAPGQISTLILPADTAWNEGSLPVTARAAQAPRVPDEKAVSTAAKLLKEGKNTVLMLSGSALVGRALEVAGKIAATTNCQLMAPLAMARVERGAGRVDVERIPYAVPASVARMADVTNLVLVGCTAPTAFFAYPNMPSVPTRPDCNIHTLAMPDEDLTAALEAVAEVLEAVQARAIVQAFELCERPRGPISREGFCRAIAHTIPENAIVVDESNTSGRGLLLPTTARSLPHDWMVNTGGAIGYALPAALGAAMACPDRKVICLESDGSAMFTLQALWTMAREGAAVTTLILANRTYETLNVEMKNTGAGPAGSRAQAMLDIDRPTIDWVSMAKSVGVPAARTRDLEELCRLIERGVQSDGPSVIEVDFFS